MPATHASSPDNRPTAAGWLALLRPRLQPYTRSAVILIDLLTAFRLWYCTRLELVGDEAYYWLWSKHLDLSYFSKGPGVAWTIALGTGLFGDTVFGIRWISVLLAAGTGWGIFLLGRMLFSSRVGFWSLVVAAVIPLFSVGSILMTIDPLSVYFWTMAALAFWRAKDHAFSGWWIATGLAVGLGALCRKYTNLVELLCFLLFCLWSVSHRGRLRQPGFWLMVAAALLCQLPVVIWNAQNQWITIDHLVHRGSLDRPWRFSPRELFQFISMQAVVISPLFFIGVLAAAGRAFQFQGKASDVVACPWRYLLCLFLPLFTFYTFLSLNENGEANWTAPSYVAGIILLTAMGIAWSEKGRRLRLLVQTAVVLAAVETALLHNTFPLNLPIKSDPLSRVRGSENLATQVHELQQSHGANFLVTNRYSTSSLLAFYLPDHPMTYLPRGEGYKNQFSFWPDYSDGFHAASALFVTDSDEMPASLARDFREVTWIKDVQATHRGRPIRLFHVYLCREFTGVVDAPAPEDMPGAPPSQ